MGTAIKIKTEMNGYGDGLVSGDLNVRARWGFCHIGVVPEGREGRQEQGGPMIPGPWGYEVIHAAVIDNHGGSGRAMAAAQQIELGVLVEVEGLPGKYTFAQRDQRNLEGDGVKLVAADDAARANEARCKALGELGRLAEGVGRAGVTHLEWRAGRAADAIAELEAATGVAALRERLEDLKAEAATAGKLV